MAAVVMQQTVSSSADDELTPEQIDQLLNEASARLRGNQSLVRAKYYVPELSVGKEISRILVEHREEESITAKVNVQHQEQTPIGFRKVEDPVAAKALAEERKKATAGAMWHDLPKTEMTPELKRDMQLIKMRGILDPHRHYKKDNGKMKVPEYSMVGTIKEGATEFYSGRIENKKRKRTLVEQVLAEEDATGRFRRKAGELREKNMKGKKRFYNKLMDKRRKRIKGSGS